MSFDPFRDRRWFGRSRAKSKEDFPSSSVRSDRLSLQDIVDKIDPGTYDVKLKLVSFYDGGRFHSAESHIGGEYIDVPLTYPDSSNFFGPEYAFGAVRNQQYNSLDLYFHPEFQNLLQKLIPSTGIKFSLNLADGEPFHCMEKGNASTLYEIAKKITFSDLQYANNFQVHHLRAYGAVRLLYNFLRDKDIYDGFKWECLIETKQISYLHFKEIHEWAIERDLRRVNTTFHNVEENVAEHDDSLGAVIPEQIDPHAPEIESQDSTVDFKLSAQQIVAEKLPDFSEFSSTDSSTDTLSTLSTPESDTANEIHNSPHNRSKEARTHRRRGGVFVTEDDQLHNLSDSWDDRWDAADSWEQQNFNEFEIKAQIENESELTTLLSDFPLPSSDTTLTISHTEPGLLEAKNEDLDDFDLELDLDFILEEPAPIGLFDDELFLSSIDSVNSISPDCDDIPKLTQQGKDTATIHVDDDILVVNPEVDPYFGDKPTETSPPSKLDVDVHSHFVSLYEKFIQMESHIEDSIKQRYNLVRQALLSRQTAWDTGIANIYRMIRKKPPEGIRNILCVNMVEAAMIGALENNTKHAKQAHLHKEIFLKNLDIWRCMLLRKDDRILYSRAICQIWSRADIIADDPASNGDGRPNVSQLFRLVTTVAKSSERGTSGADPPEQGERLRDLLAKFLRKNKNRQFSGKLAKGAIAVQSSHCSRFKRGGESFGEYASNKIFLRPGILQSGIPEGFEELEVDPLQPPDQDDGLSILKSPNYYKRRDVDDGINWVFEDFISLTTSLMSVLVLFILVRDDLYEEKNIPQICKDPFYKASLIVKNILDPLPGFSFAIPGFSEILDMVTAKVHSGAYENIFLLLNDIICCASGICELNALLILVRFLHHGLDNYISTLMQLLYKVQEAQIFQYFGFKAGMEGSFDIITTPETTINEVSLFSPSSDALSLSTSDFSNYCLSNNVTPIQSFADSPEGKFGSVVELDHAMPSQKIQTPVAEAKENPVCDKIALPPLDPSLRKRKLVTKDTNPVKKPRATTSGEFKCSDCESVGMDKYFANLQNMRRHMRERHSKNPPRSQCPSCGDKFSRDYAIKHKCRAGTTKN